MRHLLRSVQPAVGSVVREIPSLATVRGRLQGYTQPKAQIVPEYKDIYARIVGRARGEPR
jgi:hypothetical protein